MIIIEETEEDKNSVSVPDEDFIEEEELTTEEQKYRSAQELLDSLACVTRYEQGVKTLLDAAAMFEEINDYGDSAKRAADCRKRAGAYEKKGIEKAYREAVKLCEEAVTKMDYRTAISELNRFPDYKDCKERIDVCKRAVEREETKQAWKHRVIAAVIVVAAVIGVWAVFRLI